MIDIETRSIDQLPEATAVSPDALVVVQEPGGPATQLKMRQLLGRLISTEEATELEADLQALLDHDANTIGLVFADPDPAKNGWYRKTNGPGVGPWVQFEQLSSYAAAQVGALLDAASAGLAAQVALAEGFAVAAAASATGIAAIIDSTKSYEDAPVVFTGPNGQGFFGCIDLDGAYSAKGGTPISGERLDRMIDEDGDYKGHLLYPEFIRAFPAELQALKHGADVLVHVVAEGDSYFQKFGDLGLLARDLKAEASERGHNGNGGFGWCGAGFAGALGAEPNGNVDPDEIRPIFIGTDWAGQYSVEQHSPDLCSATTSTAGNGIIWPYSNADTIATLDLHHIGNINARYRWNEAFSIEVSNEAELLALRAGGIAIGTKVLRRDNVTVYSYSYAGLPESEGGSAASLADWTVLPWSAWTSVEALTATGAATPLAGIPEGSWALHTENVAGTFKVAGLNGLRSRGLVFHNFANNGLHLVAFAGYNDLTVPPPWRKAVAEAIVRVAPRPVLWIVGISPNDQGQKSPYHEYELAVILSHDDIFRTINPGSDILFVCPAENGRSVDAFPQRIAGYTKRTKAQAFQREFAVFDMQVLAGKDYPQYGHLGTQRRWFLDEVPFPLHMSPAGSGAMRHGIFTAVVYRS